MRNFFVAVIAVEILSKAVIGPGKILDQNLLKGNFYKMDNTSDLNIAIGKISNVSNPPYDSRHDWQT